MIPGIGAPQDWSSWMSLDKERVLHLGTWGWQTFLTQAAWD